MLASDVPQVLHIQAQTYAASILEDAAFFLNRLALSAATCQVAEQRHRLLGYLVSYPWLRHAPPPLNAPCQQLPDAADSWFVHDCAVDPAMHGLGIAGRLLHAARRQAMALGLRHASLVSLPGACSYWQRLGYQPAGQQDPVLQAKLAGYGAGAAYMTCTLQHP